MWQKKAGRYVRISALGMFLMLMACSDIKPYRLEPGELFPDGRPLGQFYTHKQPEIRMVRVSSVHEADSFCMALPEKYPLRGGHHPHYGFSGHSQRHKGDTLCRDRQTEEKIRTM